MSAPAGDPRVVAVIVTWNRREAVSATVAAVLGQTRAPDHVVLVDNASTDGTAAAVRAAFGEAVELVTLPRNTGGAGGFAVGTALALAAGADLIWLLDDDGVPGPTALAALLDARAAYAASTGVVPALLASRVVWTDGRAHPMNTPRPRPLVARAARAAAQAVGCVPIRSASFVSILLDARAVRRAGLPRADFFLWNDDFEFTARLLRHDVGLLCPASVVEHRTTTFGDSQADPGERFYFEVRNKVWTLTSAGVLGPLERLLYGGATLRRWLRTFRASRDRATLRRGLVRGLRDGLRARPRPTALVLADVGVSVDAA